MIWFDFLAESFALLKYAASAGTILILAPVSLWTWPRISLVSGRSVSSILPYGKADFKKAIAESGTAYEAGYGMLIAPAESSTRSVS